jgi:hypothetical protein
MPYAPEPGQYRFLSQKEEKVGFLAGPMQLSAEMFRRIVDNLRTDERTCTRHEKRKEGRVGMRCAVNVMPKIFDDKGQRTLQVKVRDISQSGMGFLTHEQMAVGLELICKLPCDDNTDVEVIMTVRHCVKISKGLYGIGTCFAHSKVETAAGSKVKNAKPAAVVMV